MPESIKILLVCSSLYPDKIGGIEIWNYQFIQWLSRQKDFEPVVIVRGSGKSLENVSTYLIRGKIWKIPANPVLARLITFFTTILREKRNRRTIIHFSYARSNGWYWLLCSLICRFWQLPYVIYIHGGGLYSWRPELPFKFAFKGAADLVAVSEAVQKEYQNRTNCNIKVLPALLPFIPSLLSCSEAKSRLGFPETATLFLTVGSLKPIKGTDILISAFNRLEKNVLDSYDVHLLFAGDGLLAEYKEKVAEDRKKRVCFIGPVANEVIPDYYRAADIYCLSSRMEGWPISLLEALYNGLPCIVSDLPAFRKNLQPGIHCLKFPVEDAKRLSENMMTLISETDQRLKLGKAAAKKFQKELNAASAFDKISKIYKDILNQ